MINEEVIISNLSKVNYKEPGIKKIVTIIEDNYPEKGCVDITNIFKNEINKIIDDRYHFLSEEAIKNKNNIITNAHLKNDYKVILGDYKTQDNSILIINNKNNIEETLDSFFKNEILEEGLKVFKTSKALKKILKKIEINSRLLSGKDLEEVKAIYKKLAAVAAAFEYVENMKNKTLAKSYYKKLKKEYIELLKLIKKDSAKRLFKTMGLITYLVSLFVLPTLVINKLFLPEELIGVKGAFRKALTYVGISVPGGKMLKDFNEILGDDQIITNVRNAIGNDIFDGKIEELS